MLMYARDSPIASWTIRHIRTWERCGRSGGIKHSNVLFYMVERTIKNDSHFTLPQHPSSLCSPSLLVSFLSQAGSWSSACDEPPRNGHTGPNPPPYLVPSLTHCLFVPTTARSDPQKPPMSLEPPL
jgi:hypothetical protein